MSSRSRSAEPRTRRVRHWTLVLTTSSASVLGSLLSACSADDISVLHATASASSSTGGANGGMGGAGTVVTGGAPFCEFAWGRQWVGSTPTQNDTPAPQYSDGLGFLSVWVGYEPDDGMNPAIEELLQITRPGSDHRLASAIPVFYAYFIAFKSKNRADLEPCDPSSTTPNLCTEGAQWIRDNRDYLHQVYDDYAARTAALYGTTRPIVWLLEPDFSNYARVSQSAPLSPTELSTVASDLISTIRARLPNARVAHFASPSSADFSRYFASFDLSLVSLVFTTGWSTSPSINSTAAVQNPSATYANLHAATGLPIFVDTGFGATLLPDTWTTAAPAQLNQRIAEGVVAANIEPPPEDLGARIQALRPELTPLCPP